MSTAKDELIARLENEMKEQLVFVDKTIKVLYSKHKYLFKFICLQKALIIWFLFFMGDTCKLAFQLSIPTTLNILIDLLVWARALAGDIQPINHAL